VRDCLPVVVDAEPADHLTHVAELHRGVIRNDAAAAATSSHAAACRTAGVRAAAAHASAAATSAHAAAPDRPSARRHAADPRTARTGSADRWCASRPGPIRRARGARPESDRSHHCEDTALPLESNVPHLEYPWFLGVPDWVLFRGFRRARARSWPTHP